MLDLTDIMELSRLEKEQLMQLCNALYRLLLDTKQTVIVPAVSAGADHVPPIPAGWQPLPVNPIPTAPTWPTLPNNPTVICGVNTCESKTQEAGCR